MTFSFKPNDAIAFVANILVALLFIKRTAGFLSNLSEIDKNKGGASLLLIIEECSIPTQMTFEYEIADDLANLKIKSTKESEHSKMIVVEDWIVAL